MLKVRYKSFLNLLVIAQKISLGRDELSTAMITQLHLISALVHLGVKFLSLRPYQDIEGGLTLGEMTGNFVARYIRACPLSCVYSLSGEIFFFKIVKMNLTNLRRKKSSQLLDQSKTKYISILFLSANKFQLDQIEDAR